MARFDSAFDATGIEPTTAYEILPAGKYRAQIVESEMRVTKNGMGQYLWLMLDILEGPQQGRKVFDQLNLVNANPTTVEIAQRTLSAICHATGKLQVNDSEELLAVAPLVERGVADPVPPAQLGNAKAGLVLLQDADDLFFAEPALAHLSVSFVGDRLTSERGHFRGQGHAFGETARKSAGSKPRWSTWWRRPGSPD